MRILLTNDDGITTFSTFHLGELLEEKGHEVFIIVPVEDQSGISGAMSFRKHILTSRIKDNAVAVTGTPCDCINLLVAGVICDNNFDLVISGINKGENAGRTIYDSGTVAAARRAKIYGYKTIAVSYADNNATKEDMELCNKYVVELLEKEEYFISQKDNKFVNINVPSRSKVEGMDLMNTKVESTFVGRGDYGQIFKQLGEGHFLYDNADALDEGTFVEGCDHDALQRGRTSISYIEI